MADQPPAVRDDLFGQRLAGSHQERRPIHGVEADDVLADHVNVGGPEFAKRFVAAAAARDTKTLENLLSPAISARAGKEGIEKILNEQVRPFFADHKEIGRSVTTTGTIDAHGYRGFTFYMYSMTRSGQKKPFVIYVVDEKGQKVVANILVNRFIEGLHR